MSLKVQPRRCEIAEHLVERRHAPRCVFVRGGSANAHIARRKAELEECDCKEGMFATAGSDATILRD
jgi:hypothetical protein